MKQKNLLSVMVLCVLVLFLNVNAANADAAKGKEDLNKSKLSPAQQFYYNFKNNIISDFKIDINVKNQDYKHLFNGFSSLYKIPFVYKVKKKKTFTFKITKGHVDLIVYYMITRCNLEIEVDGDKIVIKDKKE